MTIRFHRGDLPDLTRYRGAVAVDTETLGLNPHRDRLCLVQLSPGDGSADIIQIARTPAPAPNLARLLGDPTLTKIFHFARFDLTTIYKTFGVMAEPVFCTKIASRLTRTYAERHSLKDIVKEFLDIEISKQQQTSDWGAETPNDAQLAYAASDVLYLHALREKLEDRLNRDGRREFADACFKFLPTRSRLDLAGWAEEDIFAHS
jgi:ribonuclease D